MRMFGLTRGDPARRTYAEVKTMRGEWKADPRFKDSWFFVREDEAKEEGEGERK